MVESSITLSINSNDSGGSFCDAISMITFVESEYSLSKTETVIVSLPNQSFSGDIKTSLLDTS